VDTSRGGRAEIVLLVRVVGPGSRRLGERKVGERLDVVGPLGNGFDLSLAKGRAVLVGGGCGIAPLVGVARELVAAGNEVTVYYGANTAANVPLTLPRTAEQPGGRGGPPLQQQTASPGSAGGLYGNGKRQQPGGHKARPYDGNDERPGDVEPIVGVGELPGAALVLATDDGSAGLKGLVTEAMLAHDGAAGLDGSAIYACGPDVMMAALAALAKVHDVRHCQVSLENYMGCAIGVCLSCAAKIRAANERGWTYQRVCVDGPVFEASEVIFESKWEGCKR
jgi:dihydroorotate dehydrogenase electron transfer subunit